MDAAWSITALERSRHDQQFGDLAPVAGLISGEQARGFFLQSRLPLPVLGKIWSLADYNADGKMDAREFSVACKLITMKLQGYEVPDSLPSPLSAVLSSTSPGAINDVSPLIHMTTVPANNGGQVPAVPLVPGAAAAAAVGYVPTVPLVPGTNTPPVASVKSAATEAAPPRVAPAANVSSALSSQNVTRSPSLASQDSGSGMGSVGSGAGGGGAEQWAVPQSARLRYGQQFNQLDRVKSGLLSGTQARGVLMHSGLSTALLAQIWFLADVNTDGYLSMEEFILALHLCDLAKQGSALPATLPPDLVPPSLRHIDHATEPAANVSLSSQDSFEEKRRENYNRGQAELERRRKVLEEQQQREREQQQERERARREQEERRQQQLQEQLESQRQLQLQQEEARRRELEQQEEARRRELEQQEEARQQQLQNSKRRELEAMRLKQHEQLLQLRAHNSQLSAQLETASERVKTLTKSIGETRSGVTQVKSAIDGMRATRDSTLGELTSLKSQLREQNNRLLQANQELAQLDSTAGSADGGNMEARRQVVDQMREKATQAEAECEEKQAEVELCRSKLAASRDQLQLLTDKCRQSYTKLRQDQREVKRLCGQPTPTVGTSSNHQWTADFTNAPTTAADSSGGNNSSSGGGLYSLPWRTSNTESAQYQSTWVSPTKTRVPYRALFDFEARSGDELSFQANDIIMINRDAETEAEWLEGELNGSTGWLPESYVEPVESVQNGSAAATVGIDGGSGATNNPVDLADQNVCHTVPETESGDVYVALYAFTSSESGDLCFQQGDRIQVIARDGDWWTGRLGEATGIFPSNYVQPAQSVTVSAGDNQDTAAAEAPHTSEDTVTRVTSDLQQKRKGEVAVVLAEYEATSAEQLSLSRGQMVMVRKKSATGWWQGELQLRGKQRQLGWFPQSFVKLKTSRRMSLPDVSDPIMPDAQCPGDVPHDPDASKDLVVAQFAYTAQHDDELSFDTDAVITVLNKDDVSWWKGELNGKVGLFPSNYVVAKLSQFGTDRVGQWLPGGEQQQQEEQEEMIPAQQRASHRTVSDRDMALDKSRSSSVQELISSEQTYVSNLDLVSHVFRRPLVASGLLSKQESGILFSNLHELLACNRKLLAALRARSKLALTHTVSLSVGDILYQHLSQMQCYRQFCSGQLRAGRLLQAKCELPDFSALLRRCQSHPQAAGLPLASFLLQPMQRITKYPLLIRQVIKYTFAGHPDSDDMQMALEAAETLCKQTNSVVGDVENTDLLDWLQDRIDVSTLSERLVFNSLTNLAAPRKLLHFSVLTKWKSGREVFVFLFNDLLLMATSGAARSLTSVTVTNIQAELADIKLKLYRKPFLLDGLRVRSEVEAAAGACWDPSASALSISDDAGLQVALSVHSAAAHSLWLKQLGAAVQQLQLLKQQQQLKIASRVCDQEPCARLLVTVMSAIHLASNNDNGKSDPFCELRVGDEVQCTPVLTGTANPCWEHSLQFPVYSVREQTLSVCVFDRQLYAPHALLGRNQLPLAELCPHSPPGGNTSRLVLRRVPLLETRSGQLDLKLDLVRYHGGRLP